MNPSREKLFLGLALTKSHRESSTQSLGIFMSAGADADPHVRWCRIWEGQPSRRRDWAAGKGQSVQGGEELLMALEDSLRFYLARFKCPDTLFVAPSQNDPVPTREHVEVTRC